VKEIKARSLVKTVTWRLTGSGATFLIAFLVLGDIAISSGIALIQLITNTILYYFHERIWNIIKWGKE
jgi:uncharacterized membrane protein